MSSVRDSTCALNAAEQATTSAETSTSTRRMAADYMTEAADRLHNVPATRGVLILGNRISDRRRDYGNSHLGVTHPRGADGSIDPGAGCAQRPAGGGQDNGRREHAVHRVH